MGKVYGRRNVEALLEQGPNCISNSLCSICRIIFINRTQVLEDLEDLILAKMSPVSHIGVQKLINGIGIEPGGLQFAYDARNFDGIVMAVANELAEVRADVAFAIDQAKQCDQLDDIIFVISLGKQLLDLLVAYIIALRAQLLGNARGLS